MDPHVVTAEHCRNHVIEALREFFKITGTRPEMVGFKFKSTNDQGTPPFKAVAGGGVIMGNHSVEEVISTLQDYGWVKPHNYHSHLLVLEKGNLRVTVPTSVDDAVVIMSCQDIVDEDLTCCEGFFKKDNHDYPVGLLETDAQDITDLFNV